MQEQFTNEHNENEIKKYISIEYLKKLGSPSR